MATITHSPKKGRKSMRSRTMIWSLVIIAVSAMVLPAASYLLSSYVYSGIGAAQAQVTDQNTNQRSNFWRAVREGNTGYSAVQGPEAGTLINNGGQNWRQQRNGLIANYGGWLLIISLFTITMFYLYRGRVNIDKPASGATVPRWSLIERTMHWYTAVLFIVLAITGLSLMFGRVVLIPLLGAKGFALWASFSMALHNYLGPFFSIGVVLILIAWLRHNLPSATDVKWFTSGGGLKYDVHPSADKANAGEKVWFWIVILVGGVAVCISGFVLDFPIWGQTREVMQLANLVHGIAALIWIAVFFGHAYIGTIGTEGALDGMTTGRVSAEWAHQHHDIWYDKVKHLEEATPRTVSGGTVPSSSSSG